MPQYLTEWYLPDLCREQLHRAGRDIADAVARLALDGPVVELLLTIAAPADEVAFALFTAPCAETVELVCRDAGHPVTRIAEALSTPSLSRPSRSTWSPA